MKGEIVFSVFDKTFISQMILYDIMYTKEDDTQMRVLSIFNTTQYNSLHTQEAIY